MSLVGVLSRIHARWPCVWSIIRIKDSPEGNYKLIFARGGAFYDADTHQITGDCGFALLDALEKNYEDIRHFHACRRGKVLEDIFQRVLGLYPNIAGRLKIIGVTVLNDIHCIEIAIGNYVTILALFGKPIKQLDRFLGNITFTRETYLALKAHLPQPIFEEILEHL